MLLWRRAGLVVSLLLLGGLSEVLQQLVDDLEDGRADRVAPHADADDPGDSDRPLEKLDR